MSLILESPAFRHGEYVKGTFSTDKISGLQNFVESHSQGGIANQSLNENGYVKFDGGLTFIWGTFEHIGGGSDPGSDVTYFSHTLEHYFNTKGLAIFLQLYETNDNAEDNREWTLLAYDLTARDFKYQIARGPAGNFSGLNISYLAIGY